MPTDRGRRDRRPGGLRTSYPDLDRLDAWRLELWRTNLQELREPYEATMANWVNPALLPPFDVLVQDVTRRLRELKLD